MALRITTSLMTNRAIQAAQRHLVRIGDAQQKASTGLRVNRPSDDPSATRSILMQRTIEHRLQADIQNIQSSRVRLNASVSSLLELKDLLVQAKDVALQGQQSSERPLLATSVDQQLSRLAGLANSQVDGHFLFGGAASTNQPFLQEAGTADYEYVGSLIRSRTIVGVDLEVDVLYRGDEVFHARDRQATHFFGTTGAESGQGTDSATGRGRLTVAHVDTSYAGGSGIAPGTDSAAGDTIVGPPGAHTLTIVDTSGDGSSGTISLNEGTAVNFSNGDTNLRLTGPLGEVVYLDTTAITPGFSGEVDITSNGTLSVDGGSSVVNIDFSDNVAVTHAEEGTVTYVDSQAIRQTGEERLEYLGTSSVFEVLQFLRDDLSDGSLPESEAVEAISRSIGELDRVMEHVLSIVGEQSVALESLDSIEARHEVLQLDTRSAIGDLESADIPKALIDLQYEQNLLQFTYTSTSVLFSQNILDFI